MTTDQNHNCSDQAAEKKIRENCDRKRKMKQNLKRTLYVLVAISIIAFIIFNVVYTLKNKPPCNFWDSINITNGALQPDSSILFKNQTFTKDQYYRKDSSTLGCFRKDDTKPTIRICCRGKEQKICQKQKHLEREVLNKHNKSETWSLEEHFGIIFGTPPCKIYTEKSYSLTYKGNVFYDHSKITFQKDSRKFCLRPDFNGTQLVKFTLRACSDMTHVAKLAFDAKTIMMLVSVPFLVATFLVYISIPELRNLHGKCLLGYLMCMAIGHTCFSLVKIFVNKDIPKTVCDGAGYTIYFAYISAFLWSNVISFDMWWNVQHAIGFLQSERKRFTIYTLFVWGITFLLVVIASILNSIESIPDHWRIGIGGNTCFLKSGEGGQASQILYFYLPLCIMWTMNVIFFLLTVRRIITIQYELKAMLKADSAQHQRKFNKDKQNFLLYLRLSILMGLTWIMEGISYFVDDENYIVTDIWNCAQGVLIFIFFVMKRRVLDLIKQKFLCNRVKWRICDTAMNSTAMTMSTTDGNGRM